jgi:riboflavin synthase
MFTGIIKAVGEIEHVQERDGDRRLTIVSDQLPWQEFAVGESIAVNGVCLTAVSLSDRGFAADVSTETLDVTTLGGLGEGSKVNLEPSLRLDERLGGHLVSGHVDCIGTVVVRRDDANSIRLGIELAADLQRYLARKGSVCVDGVSLTINAVSGKSFEVNIIPHTAAHTIIGEYREGSVVNIEVDLVARYLERLLKTEESPGISLDYLREHGYA